MIIKLDVLFAINKGMKMLKLLKITGVVALTLILLSILFVLLKPDPWITLSEQKTQIRYVGKISFEGYEKLVQVYEEAEKKPTLLKITSRGGTGLAGILIGRFIQENGLNIYVSGHCISSCANYIFPAGEWKILSDDALVIYHGGLAQKNLINKMLASHQAIEKGDTFIDENRYKEAFLSPASEREKTLVEYYFPDNGACIKPPGDYEAIVESARKCFDFKQNIEKEFFEMLGVDPQLPYYGQEGNYVTTYQSYDYIGFYYDLASLEKMGVSDIALVAGEWEVSNNSNFENVYKVSLSDNVLNYTN